MPISGSGTGTPITASSAAYAPDRSAPLLPLDEWRRIIGWNPWHFHGFSNAAMAPTSNCNGVVKQYDWQGADAAGRANVIESILAAEQKLQMWLGYAPAPQFESDLVAYSRHNTVRRGQSYDASGRWLAVKLNNGNVKAVGQMTRTLIGDVEVQFHDDDGDDLNERFTLTVGTTVTDATEIGVYFTQADRFDGSEVSERWRVVPVTVKISGGVATINGRSWTIGRPVKYEAASAPDLDPSVAGNFAASLSVYRVYADTTQQGAFEWETAPTACCEGLDPSGLHSADARFTIRNAELGYVAGETATYDTTAAVWRASRWGLCYEPTHVRVNYLAGAPLEAGQMSGQMKAIVTRLAAAELTRRICSCDTANHALHQWQFDMARAAGANDEQYSISDGDLSNPFGTRGGQIWAWKQVKHLALMGAAMP